jgi:hypothetical protein
MNMLNEKAVKRLLKDVFDDLLDEKFKLSSFNPISVQSGLYGCLEDYHPDYNENFTKYHRLYKAELEKRIKLMRKQYVEFINSLKTKYC